jgi:hypothetical protein
MAKYNLLSVESDTKTSKGTAFGYLTGILYLAPATEADGVHNLCPMASPECRKACLYGAGMAGVFPTIKEARIAKTLHYLTRPEEFKAVLVADIRKLVKFAKAGGLIPAVRINGTSDLPQLALEIAAVFPEVVFYDYTKISRPWQRTKKNYHLTFSFSGTNLEECLEALRNGTNVTVVFRGRLPEVWNGYRVIDGDVSDLRFLDPAGVIVGLKAKGDARSMEAGGFVQLGKAA